MKTLSLLLLGVVAVGTVSVIELKRRHDLYWYDVQQDYRYSFGDAVRRVPVRVSRDTLELPGLGNERATALLALTIRAELSSAWFEPSIEITGETGSWTQYLERRAEGLRYLVLSPDALEDDVTLSLRGRHVSWDEQEGELLLFRNPDLENRSILVLAPHPDDAEIAAFGLYSRTNSWIVTVSAGNYVDGLYAHLADDAAAQDSLRGDVRAWDSVVVPLWGGVIPSRTVNLGYRNGSLAGLYQHRSGRGMPGGAADDPARFRQGAVGELLNGRAANASWESMVEDIRIVLENVEPDIVVAPHPRIDAADDHRFTTVALLEALEQRQDNSTLLLLYTNHHVLSEYYPFGPSLSVIGLPPIIDGRLGKTSLYSRWLTADDQMNKLFALDAMHDLRAAPRVLTGGPAERFVILLDAAVDGLRRNPLGTYSYIRRSVRANELFFVVDPSERRHLRDTTALP